MKNNKGITLISLVITIIVLLILAGISLQMLSGDNSIISRAREAKEQMIGSQNTELLNLKILESSFDGSTPDISVLIPKLQEIGCTVSGESYPLSVELNGESYQINNDGTLENIGKIENLIKEENYLIVMPASKSKFEGKTNVGTILEFKALVEAGTFNYNNVYLYENIDLGGSASNAWSPIGDGTNRFDKVFDGRNYNISGLYLSNSSQGQGLFKINAGTIKNVTINGQASCTANGVGAFAGQNDGIIEKCTSNVTIVGNEYVGGIVGYNYSTGTVRNCISNNYIKGTQIVGGLVGGNDGIITDCTNTGKVESTSNEQATTSPGTRGIGGITGITFGNISNSKNMGEIVSVSNCIGGIVGTNAGAQISKCANEGVIVTNGFMSIGGIVGYQIGDSSSADYCYNTNRVEGGHDIGGIVGSLKAGQVNNCYNIGQISSYLDISQHSNGIVCAGGIVGSSVDGGHINNCYSLDSLNIEIVGELAGNPLDEYSGKKSEAYMKSDEFVTLLNSDENNFKKGSTYPILNWQ